MSKSWLEIHPDFRLNGIHYSFEDLWDVGYSLIKEGEYFEKPIGYFFQDWIDDDDTVVVKTSGSTGSPKEIILKKAHMVNSALATGDFFDLKSGQTALHCLPSYFIAGKMMLVRAMVLGLQLDYIEPTSNPLLNIIKSYNFCAMVPLQVENNIDKLAHIEKLIIGGAAVSKELSKKIARTDCRAFETYGMTETITHVAARSINKKDENFQTLPAVKIGSDNRGCLVIDAPKISADKIITNDLVEIISENKFNWLGRYDNVINSGGVKLIPELIEKKLSEAIPHRFFVTGISDKKLGEKLVLVVEGTIDLKTLESQILALKSLDKYEIPKEILSLPKFITTENGKTKRTVTLQKAQKP